MEVKTFRRGTVTADFIPHGAYISCWSDGTTWNGFGKPYFRRQAVDWLMQLKLQGVAWKREHLLVWDGQEWEVVTPITIDGRQAWGIGAGSWCWDEVIFEGEQE